MSARYLLAHEPLDAAAAIAAAQATGAGGIVSFTGVVRERSRGRAVTLLEYEAYPEMAESVFAQIGDEALATYDILGIAIHHRVGTLRVGEISVVVAVCAVHRAAAFDACRFAIDRLKQTAPIWKKEHGPDGAVWVEDRP